MTDVAKQAEIPARRSAAKQDPAPEHDALVAKMTGGMTRRLPAEALAPFSGSARLRPDGRPGAEFRDELRRIADLRNVLTCLSAIGLPVLSVGVVIALDHWSAIAAGVLVMGILQNRMFILHHEGAHRLLFSNRRVNDLIGVNLFGWLAFGTGTHAYRRGHANHHRDEFGPKEPDFILYSFYPVKRSSLRRKLLRDASGISAYRILKPRITGIVRRRFFVNSARFFAGQGVVLGLFAVAGHPWLYLWLWVLPYAVVYQVLNRLRAIAEHGGMTRSSDRRATSHHVRQSLLARSVLVPYGVGYHLAHHVDSGIPFRNLPRLQAALDEDGYAAPALTWQSYPALWKALAAG
ncbi:MAG: fatty acid desaturase [Actinomycetota bacterium]|nr:fatty acid desaturase [Actinomycetota bacterium]